MARKKDLTGLTFGRLTVLCEYGRNKQDHITWLCQCSCGNFKIVSGVYLTRGQTKSCGCLRNEKSSDRISKRNKEMNKKRTGENNPMYKDLTGKKFGRLTVIREVGQNKHGCFMWHCICDCGNECDVLGTSLTRGATKSCGCYKKEMTGENNPSWNGGSSFAPYCEKFNDAKKEEIRDKYNRMCTLCGKTKEENNNRELSVHHIDRNKDQGCNGHSWDLVPLCMSCHGKVHSPKNEEFYASLIRARMRIHNI